MGKERTGFVKVGKGKKDKVCQKLVNKGQGLSKVGKKKDRFCQS